MFLNIIDNIIHSYISNLILELNNNDNININKYIAKIAMPKLAIYTLKDLKTNANKALTAIAPKL